MYLERSPEERVVETEEHLRDSAVLGLLVYVAQQLQREKEVFAVYIKICELDQNFSSHVQNFEIACEISHFHSSIYMIHKTCTRIRILHP